MEIKKIVAQQTVIMLAFLILLPTAADTSKLEVHFLDVGQGDCAIILCDGESMVIDGGPRGSSQLVYNYIHDTLHLTHIDYIISTHPQSFRQPVPAGDSYTKTESKSITAEAIPFGSPSRNRHPAEDASEQTSF